MLQFINDYFDNNYTTTNEGKIVCDQAILVALKSMIISKTPWNSEDQRIGIFDIIYSCATWARFVNKEKPYFINYSSGGYSSLCSLDSFLVQSPAIAFFKTNRSSSANSSHSSQFSHSSHSHSAHDKNRFKSAKIFRRKSIQFKTRMSRKK